MLSHSHQNRAKIEGAASASASLDVHLSQVPGERVAPSAPSNLQLLEMPALSQRLPHSCKSWSDSFLWNVIIEDCQELPKGVFKSEIQLKGV